MADFSHEDVLALVELIPPGHWTTYGDIAKALGGDPRMSNFKVGTPLRNRRSPNGHRVLQARGIPVSPDSYRKFGRRLDQRDELEAEGLRFIDGRADPRRQLDAGALRGLLHQR